ncbi:MAG TPA: ethanolamine ammonia-lyase subunit EutC [Ferruginibacter sp.]|nr:ethanolamine ammonia-lyase subunit EutC [Ferruginibacter sp.]
MSSNISKNIIQPDAWHSLKAFTAARIALGKTGTAIPLKEVLEFKLAFAHARDAVYSLLDNKLLLAGLEAFNTPVHLLQSKAVNRTTYLQRPDLGRQLNDDSKNILQNSSHDQYDISIILADGLSAEAVNKNAFPLLQQLIPALQQYSIAPIVLVQNARVAISDEVGSLLRSKISLILIGERPGLSSPDSLGAYLTFSPTIGLTDESRNCVSNIRPEGLPYNFAAEKILYLIQESFRLQLSGVHLKDNAGLIS